MAGSKQPAEEFAEIWDAALRSASHLRLLSGTLCALLLVTCMGWCRSAGRVPKPVFVRVDDIGRAEVVDYDAATWQGDPLDPVTKYFLRQFVVDHFSRQRATVAERWPLTLLFLESSLANAASDALSQEIAEHAAGLRRLERRVENVVLRVQARPEPPHEAIADYEVALFAAGRERGRERWTTTLRFEFQADPPHVLRNPTGLLITFLASDRATGLE